MSESGMRRMSDERLAEIEQNWEDGYILDRHGTDLIEGIKAERAYVEELEAKLRLRNIAKDGAIDYYKTQRDEAKEIMLDAARHLSKKSQGHDNNNLAGRMYAWLEGEPE